MAATKRPTRRAPKPTEPQVEALTVIVRKHRELEQRLRREIEERESDAMQIGELLAVLADRERQVGNLKLALERRDRDLSEAEQRYSDAIAKMVGRARGEQIEATIGAAQVLIDNARALAEATEIRLHEAREAAARIGLPDANAVVESGMRAVAGTLIAIEPVEAAIRRASVVATSLRNAERQADEAREKLPDLLGSLARTTERLRGLVGRLAATPLKSLHETK